MFKVVENIKQNLNLKINTNGEFAARKLNHQVNILYLNIQSLRNKITHFSNFVEYSRTSYHIIILSETHIKEDDKDFFNLPGYQVVHCIRKGNSFGGVSIFIKRDFSNFNVLHSLEFELNNSLLISLDRLNIRILAFYKYRESNNEIFLNHIQKSLSSNDNLIVVGDFNIDLFKMKGCNFESRYHDLIISNGHIFLNDLSEPTRITLKNSEINTATLIDHIYSDIPFTRPNYEFHIYMDKIFGDHRAILTSIDTNSALASPPKKTITIKKTNHMLIKNHKLISKISYSNFDDFQKKLEEVFISNTSIKVMRDRFRKPFMNIEILTLMEIRQNYFRLKKKFPLSSKVTNRYKMYRNLVTSKIKEAKIKFFNDRFQKDATNLKQFWSHVNNLLRNSDRVPQNYCSALTINNTKVTNRVAIAENFNSHFATVAEKIVNSINIIPFYFDTIHGCETYEITVPFDSDSLKVSENEIATYISNLKTSDSTDVYGLSNNTIKTHKSALIQPLTLLINKCILDGCFPSSLKISKVTPLYKNSGRKDDPNEYRPLAISAIISKPIEDFMLDRFHTHLENNELIHKNQFGFSKGCSTEVAITHVLNNIYNKKDQGLSVSILFIDLQKAFDSVNHEILLNKIKKLALPRKFVTLFESYFNDRFQYVQLGETRSPTLKIQAGVFQGSKIAACLFIFYINNIFSLPLNGDIFLYADDIAIVYGAKDKLSLKDKMEQDLILLNCWLENHFLKMNLRKTKYILFQGRASLDNFVSNSLKISLDNSLIERVDSYDYLGVIIDEKLKFDSHIDMIRSRITSMAFAIKRIRPYITLSTAVQLYFQHVQSLLIYCNSCWNTATDSRIETLCIAQKRVLRFVYQKPYGSPSNELFSEKILPIELLNKYQTSLLVFKMINGSFRLNIRMQTRFEVSGRITRQSHNYNIQFSNTALGGRDFFKVGFEMFNQLPREVKKANTISKFKLVLRKYLFTQIQDRNAAN